MLLGELGVILLMTLVVGTFAEPLQSKLPWGRWIRRWRQRRVAEEIRDLEKAGAAVTDPEPEPEPTVVGGPYRDVRVVRPDIPEVRFGHAPLRPVRVAAVGLPITLVATALAWWLVPETVGIAAALLAIGAFVSLLPLSLARFVPTVADLTEGGTVERHVRVEAEARQRIAAVDAVQEGAEAELEPDDAQRERGPGASVR